MKQNQLTKRKCSSLCVALFLLIFVSGCSYHPECDQTQHGVGNIPAACKSLTYQVGGE